MENLTNPASAGGEDEDVFTIEIDFTEALRGFLKSKEENDE